MVHCSEFIVRCSEFVVVRCTGKWVTTRGPGSPPSCGFTTRGPGSPPTCGFTTRGPDSPPTCGVTTRRDARPSGDAQPCVSNTRGAALPPMRSAILPLCFGPIQVVFCLRSKKIRQVEQAIRLIIQGFDGFHLIFAGIIPDGYILI